MQLHDLVAQRQAESRAALCARARLVHAVKRLRQVRERLRRDAAAVIEHAHAAAVGQHLLPDVDVAAVVERLAGVVHEVDEQGFK